jgi:hypothetical protein
MPTANASNATKKLGKLLGMMDQGQLVLPEIQRDFVWARKSIKLLIDSLYRGLPIGHMLIWKALTAVDVKAFDKRKLKRGVHLDGFYGYLLRTAEVDGPRSPSGLRRGISAYVLCLA